MENGSARPLVAGSPRSVRTPTYLDERMFRSATLRERVRVVVEDVLEAVDVVLSEPAEPAAPEPSPHPHRRPARITRTRRGGTVAPARARCLSPVRPAAAPERRGDRSAAR